MHKPALKKHYLEKVVPELKTSQNYSNIHQIPQIEKVVLNSGIGADSDKGWVAEVCKEFSIITGQKPVVTRSRMSISNFKLRKGVPNGVKVTLRGDRMYDFLYRLITVALPAIRDFRGIPSRMDGRGNYTLGVTDHAIFPEITADGNRKTLGMDVTIVTTAQTDEEGRELLRLMGMPFRKPGQQEQKAVAIS